MLKIFCKKIFIYILSNVLIFAVFISTAGAYMRPLSQYSFNEMYKMAARGDVVSLHAAVSRGLNINAVNSNGDTGVCVAVKRRDAKAYNTFRAAGASGTPPCRWNISHWESFINSAPVQAGANWRSADYTMPVYAGAAEKSNIWWWVGGAAVIGGGAALALGGGGGGGSDDSGGDTPEPETCDTNVYIISGACPDNGSCSECSDSSGTYYKLNFCNSGYYMSEEGTSCEQDPAQTCDTTEYPLTGSCPTNGSCNECRDFAGTHYKLISCNEGYTMSSDGKSCVLSLPSCDTATYPLTGSCPTNGTCSQCIDTSGNHFQLISCDSGYTMSSDGKSCIQNQSPT